MGYIDAQYYTQEFKGLDAGTELERYIERASDIIDQLTLHKMTRKPFEQQPVFIQNQVKKAVAAQVEFYVVNGGDAELNAGIQDIGSVRIGSFSYDSKNTAGRVSPSAINHLEPTGLLHRGLDVIEYEYYQADS